MRPIPPVTSKPLNVGLGGVQAQRGNDDKVEKSPKPSNHRDQYSADCSASRIGSV
jgi:hypothetical protein